MRAFVFLIAATIASAAEYFAPAGERPAIRRPGAAGILPGGRIIAPSGSQYVTGPGPFGLAVSPNGRTVVTANGGPDRYSLTVLEQDKKHAWTARHLVAKRGKQTSEDDWRSVFMGLAFNGERSVYASEGNSGRVRLADLASGSARRIYDLNQGEFRDSYTGDLALDPQRGLLFVVDQANFRLVTIDTARARVISSLRIGRLPFAIALSQDRTKAFVTNVGIFEYRPVPGADPKHPVETALPFPAFGFPSVDSLRGARRETARGPVDVPALGDPNVRQSNSVAVVDIRDPAHPKIETFVRAGLPLGDAAVGGSSPSGVLATADRVYVSNGHNDSITAIDPKTNAIIGEIPIRIPGLESLRGVLPMGMAYDSGSGWLLVAEAGINAVGVIDTRRMAVVGHLPVAWFPTRVQIDRGNVYVANARGQGAGPNARRTADGDSFLGTLRRGCVSVFPMPKPEELPGRTGLVLQANGFIPREAGPAGIPPEIRHVVLIVKENRTFDEVFGDVATAANGPVRGAPPLARFGQHGYIDGGRVRLSLQEVNVTPNHHAIARRWAMSDNFYADSDVSVDGHHWLVGAYPDAWTESTRMASYGGQKDFRFQTTAPGRLSFPQSNSSVHPEEQPEAGSIWHHFERHGISFRNFGEGFELAGNMEEPGEEPTGARFLTNVPMPDPLFRNTSREYPGFNMNVPDQYRAAQFIAEIESRYVRGTESFPGFIFIHLPNDHMSKPRPDDGYPYTASFVADNDLALGKILEYLSHSRWWRNMAVFITEDDAQGGVDHVDAHRTVLIAAGPYVRRNHVLHVNSSFPGLLKTVFRILHLPPLNLFDAAASDLGGVFLGEADFTPYDALPVDARLFDPAQAKRGTAPSPRMDDPAAIREVR